MAISESFCSAQEIKPIIDTTVTAFSVYDITRWDHESSLYRAYTQKLIYHCCTLRGLRDPCSTSTVVVRRMLCPDISASLSVSPESLGRIVVLQSPLNLSWGTSAKGRWILELFLDEASF